MKDLIRLLAGRDDTVPLDVAALQLAQVEYPEQALDPFLLLMDSYALEFSERITHETDGEEFVGLLNEYLFAELEFRGDREDYYNPANSCLNDVLTRRLGIPITLSVVYMEIARRLDRPVRGIGLPGHFIVSYDDGKFSAYVDPFDGGSILTEAECFELAARATGTAPEANSALLRPVSKRQILIRMLNNLRAVYFRARNLRRVIEVLNLLIEADPAVADQYKQRGMCLAQLEAFVGAREDLETYLRLAPNAQDRTQIAERLEHLKRQSRS